MQDGDPAKPARALVQLTDSVEPPRRWAAGADAVGVFEQKSQELLAPADAFRKLSSSLAHDDVNANVCTRWMGELRRCGADFTRAPEVPISDGSTSESRRCRALR